MQHWEWNWLKKYNINGPRYTSYPTALSFHESVNTATCQNVVAEYQKPISLYIHLPFCASLCYYCGCNKVITRHQYKADEYLDALGTELELYRSVLAKKDIASVHLGGGTPTFLNTPQLRRLMALIKDVSSNQAIDELSIEVDPRQCDNDKLSALRALGFNRLSFGIQDFDNDVQVAIHRTQSYKLVADQVNHARSLGFESISFDLIYGLPLQTEARFAHTLALVERLSPDRISLFNYAHLPERFAAQRKIKESWLPKAAQKLGLFKQAIEHLTGLDYQFIGMDHFAKPNDKLAIAQREGKLTRNFQGYVTKDQSAVLGLGVSSISHIDGHYWQNEKDLKSYYNALIKNKLPIVKGYHSTTEDKIRGDLIKQLLCEFEVNLQQFSTRWSLNSFSQHFHDELQRLQPFIDDGLVKLSEEHLVITNPGKLLVRTIASCFDEYLNIHQMRYSRVI
jgi:oxygen-independent coproporphyrinogen III oxidase